MPLSEATLDAAEANFLSSVADTISSPIASRTTVSQTIPNGAWAVALAIWNGGDASDNIAVSDSGSHTWTPLHPYDTTSKFALYVWYNNTGSSVSITVTFTWHFAFNGPAGTWLGAINSAASTTPSVAATLSNSSTAQASATPSQIGSLFCLHYAQWNPTADISSLVAGSATDASPVGHAYFSSGPASIGTIYQTTPNTQTTTPVTVGAAAPTGATTYGVLVEYFPASGGTTYNQTITDSAGSTDALAQAATYARKETDDAGLTDQGAAQSVTYIDTITDDAGSTDATVRSLTATRAVVDTAGLTDALAQATTAAQTVTDQTGSTDAVGQSLAANHTLTDQAGSTDTLSQSSSSSGAQTVTDDAGTTDQLLQATTHVITFTDDAGSTDLGQTYEADYAETLTDPAGNTDGVTQQSSSTGGQTFTDNAGSTDSLLQQSVSHYAVTFTDDAGLTDLLARELDRIVTDLAGITDASSQVGNQSQTVTDVAGATDVLVQSGTNIYAYTVTDDAGISDTVTQTGRPFPDLALVAVVERDPLLVTVESDQLSSSG